MVMALAGCTEEEPAAPRPVGDPADMGLGDAGEALRDAGPAPSRDGGGGIDASVPDAGADADVAAPDAGGGADIDLSDGGSGGVTVCRPGRVDGLVLGFADGPLVFEPGGAGEVTINPFDPAEDRNRAFLARMDRQVGLRWVAQAGSAGTSFRDIRVEVVDFEEATGETFAVFRSGNGGSPLWFRNADGTLARTFARGGPVGEDLVGDRRQNNYFAVRYEPDGAVAWVRRFGANDPEGRRQGIVTSIDAAPGVVRIFGTANPIPLGNPAPGVLVFGPGEASETSLTEPAGVAFSFELDRATGELRPGSVRFIAADDVSVRAFPDGSGGFHPSGRRLIGGYTVGRTGSLRFFGAREVRPQGSVGFIAQLSGSSSVEWVLLARREGSNAAPIPSALLPLSENSVIAALEATGGDVVDYTFSVDGSTVTTSLALDGSDDLLVRLDPEGRLVWSYRLSGGSNQAIYRLASLDEDLVAVGQTGPGRALELEDSSRVLLQSPGYFVARLDAAAGRARWVQALAPVGPDPLFVERPAPQGGDLLVPVYLTAARVTRGAEPAEVRMASGGPGTGVVAYSQNGELRGCSEVLTGQHALVLD